VPFLPPGRKVCVIVSVIESNNSVGDAASAFKKGALTIFVDRSGGNR
jgi:hypothetical protein